jgi:hypothetical protein
MTQAEVRATRSATRLTFPEVVLSPYTLLLLTTQPCHLTFLRGKENAELSSNYSLDNFYRPAPPRKHVWDEKATAQEAKPAIWGIADGE